MPRHRGLALGAYLVGAALILLPLFDASISISPPRFDDVRWRFGAAGLLANALLIPNSGLLLLLITAISYEHTTFRRAVGVLALIGVAVWLAAIGVFALDALQTRVAVRPEMSASFKVASWSAIGKMLVEAATLTVLGFVGVYDVKSRQGRTPDASPLFAVDQMAARKST